VMGPLIEALANGWNPSSCAAYALLATHGSGHRVGVDARATARGLPLPRALVVSSARAPLLRRMEPPAEERDQCRAARGRRFQCDTHLYRTWRPDAELRSTSLSTPTAATEDQQLPLACIDRGARKLREFVLRAFRGGHFYFEASVEDSWRRSPRTLANHAGVKSRRTL